MANSFRPNQYLRPRTVREAVSVLAKHRKKARVIAGGTDLLVDRPPEIQCLVDISRLPLNFIKKTKGGMEIGALATMRELETSALLNKDPYLVLSRAAHEVGSVLTRNMATVGGNICNALPSADTPPALVALDAKVKTVGRTRKRVFPLEEFFVDVRKTTLKSDELLTEIHLPNLPDSKTAFMKIGRTALDLAIVNVAVRAAFVDGVCNETRIVIGGGVGPTLIRSKRAEAVLNGKKIEESLIDKAAQVASEELKPRPTSIRGSPFYKREVSKVLVRRALSSIFFPSQTTHIKR